jgi:hypothetical protein
MAEHDKFPFDRSGETFVGKQPDAPGFRYADSSMAAQLNHQAAASSGAEEVGAWDEGVQPVTSDPTEAVELPQSRERNIFAIGSLSVPGAVGETARPKRVIGRPSIVDRTPSTPYEEKVAELRRQIFSKVGHLQDLSGIRTESIGHFFQALELQPAGDCLIVNQADQPEVEAAMDEIGIPPSRNKVSGYYDCIIGLRVIFRRPEQNVAAVEKVYGHETGHATYGIVPFSPKFMLPKAAHFIQSPLRRMPWRGFYGTNVGAWAEEGFARWLDTSCGDILGSIPGSPPQIERPSSSDYLPAKYRSDATHYKYAALGWEVLFAKDEALLDAVLESRSKPAVMSEVKDRVNRFYPNLFGHLLKLRQERIPSGVTDDEHRAISRRNEEIFKHGLGMVLGSTGVRWEGVREMSGIAHEQVQKKLREYERKTGFLFR